MAGWVKSVILGKIIPIKGDFHVRINILQQTQNIALVQ